MSAKILAEAQTIAVQDVEGAHPGASGPAEAESGGVPVPNSPGGFPGRRRMPGASRRKNADPPPFPRPSAQPPPGSARLSAGASSQPAAPRRRPLPFNLLGFHSRRIPQMAAMVFTPAVLGSIPQVRLLGGPPWPAASTPAGRNPFTIDAPQAPLVLKSDNVPAFISGRPAPAKGTNLPAAPRQAGPGQLDPGRALRIG